MDDTAEMVGVLQRRFPGIAAPHKEDICYATTNRQDAVKAMAEQADLVLVIGSELGEPDWWGKPQYWGTPAAQRVIQVRKRCTWSPLSPSSSRPPP